MQLAKVTAKASRFIVNDGCVFMWQSRTIPRFVLLLVWALGALLLLFLAFRFVNFEPVTKSPLDMAEAADPVPVQVTEIVEAGIMNEDGRAKPYQILRVQVVEGAWAGQFFEIDYGRRQVAAPGVSIRVGERLMVMLYPGPTGTTEAYFVDFIRTRSMLWLLGLFVLSSILLSGWKGVRSMLAMLLSFAVIIGYILPHILQGENPVAVSTVGAFAILGTTLYLVYGWTLKTHAAVLGTLSALLITGVLAAYFINLSHLTGFGSEEAIFLSQQSTVPIDLRGLVLSSILIGALGVLDDLVITQASAVFELHLANPTLGFSELYRRAMRIGQDHVAATVNTLVLAYTGAALPLLLLVTLGGEQLTHFINREFVTEEVVRTLVGSLGLISAVPLTTGLACLVALYHARLGRLEPYLGPIRRRGEHDHHHH